jgi:hypothetical protein
VGRQLLVDASLGEGGRVAKSRSSLSTGFSSTGDRRDLWQAKNLGRVYPFTDEEVATASLALRQSRLPENLLGRVLINRDW